MLQATAGRNQVQVHLTQDCFPTRHTCLPAGDADCCWTVRLFAVDLAASQRSLVGTTLELTVLIPAPGPLQGSSSCSRSVLCWLLPTTPLKWLFQDTALCHHHPNSYPDHKLD